ncbi:hypothetical protein PR048_025400 [Dryococelus australis]|uniref:Uncharacterized protein n=1 Tax=Dryococelus australis TaxID=614101 RepID=A0ABQ9GR52_9NEOP|nr:hypothetical protein PR048_025400 [Dryococelus australis]
MQLSWMRCEVVTASDSSLLCSEERAAHSGSGAGVATPLFARSSGVCKHTRTSVNASSCLRRSHLPNTAEYSLPPRYDGNIAHLARRSDEALGVRVSVARITLSLLDLGRAIRRFVRKSEDGVDTTPLGVAVVLSLRYFSTCPEERLPFVVPGNNTHASPFCTALSAWRCTRFTVRTASPRMRPTFSLPAARMNSGKLRVARYPQSHAHVLLCVVAYLFSSRNLELPLLAINPRILNASNVTALLLGDRAISEQVTRVSNISITRKAARASTAGREFEFGNSSSKEQLTHMFHLSRIIYSRSKQEIEYEGKIGVPSAFEAEKIGSDKGDIAMRKCAIATSRKVLNWRAVFSSCCVWLWESKSRPNHFTGGKSAAGSKNPPTRGIVRHYSQLRKSGVIRSGIKPGSPSWKASRLTAQPTWSPRIIFHLKTGQFSAIFRVHSGIVVPSRASRYGGKRLTASGAEHRYPYVRKTHYTLPLTGTYAVHYLGFTLYEMVLLADFIVVQSILVVFHSSRALFPPPLWRSLVLDEDKTKRILHKTYGLKHEAVSTVYLNHKLPNRKSGPSQEKQNAKGLCTGNKASEKQLLKTNTTTNKKICNNSVCRRVFSGISHFPSPCIPTLIHAHLASLSSILNNSKADSHPPSRIYRSFAKGSISEEYGKNSINPRLRAGICLKSRLNLSTLQLHSKDTRSLALFIRRGGLVRRSDAGYLPESHGEGLWRRKAGQSLFTEIRTLGERKAWEWASMGDSAPARCGDRVTSSIGAMHLRGPVGTHERGSARNSPAASERGEKLRRAVELLQSTWRPLS